MFSSRYAEARRRELTKAAFEKFKTVSARCLLLESKVTNLERIVETQKTEINCLGVELQETIKHLETEKTLALADLQVSIKSRLERLVLIENHNFTVAHGTEECTLCSFQTSINAQRLAKLSAEIERLTEEDNQAIEIASTLPDTISTTLPTLTTTPKEGKKDAEEEK